MNIVEEFNKLKEKPNVFIKIENIKIGNLKHKLNIITINSKRYVCEESLHKVLSILTGLDGYEGLENLIKE